MRVIVLIILVSLLFASVARADDTHHFELADVFNLEYAANPQLMPDGKSVVYERRSNEIMTDSRRINLWIAALDGSGQQPLLSGVTFPPKLDP